MSPSELEREIKDLIFREAGYWPANVALSVVLKVAYDIQRLSGGLPAEILEHTAGILQRCAAHDEPLRRSTN